MKLQQLEYVLAIVDHGNHLSAAANALHTSQPGVSRQLQQLESELGLEIFQRTKNRIVGLTEAGSLVVPIARRIMSDVAALSTLETDMTSLNRGPLAIATTHTQARYILPPVIDSFIRDYPDVQIALMQGDPESICEMVSSGTADLAIGTEPPGSVPDLLSLECFPLERVLIAPEGHPILEVEELTLAEVAKYPIISYDPRFSGYWKVRRAFDQAGLALNTVFSAIDADVSKTYVRIGLGLAILTAVSFDPQRDVGLRAIPAAHLFESSMTCIKMRPNTYPRPCLLEFIRRYDPQYTPDRVRAALR